MSAAGLPDPRLLLPLPLLCSLVTVRLPCISRSEIATFAVETSTGKAEALGTPVQRGTSEDDPGYYAAYISHAEVSQRGLTPWPQAFASSPGLLAAARSHASSLIDRTLESPTC